MSDGLIAIVGASCRFPGAPGLDAFWQLLISGTDAITEIDPQRWATRYFFHPKRSERGKSYTWSAGVLDGIDLFEPAFFGISPREAVQMDPQQRLLLELVWHAVEDAGIPSRRLAGSETGVYIGASSTDYTDSRFGDPAGADTYFMTGGVLSILSNRISYIFDLHGPSLTVDTACSSSLVALHQACQALHAGHIERAIVGGVNLLLSPYPFIGFSQASMLSQRGRCFAFDERADGYARAEGGGIVILKPLAQALADGDLIRAVIHATGVNSDGRTIGLSLPSQAAQSNLLRSVYADAGISPDEIAFFEMHGTGTPAGDPIEAAAVGTMLGQARTAPLPIGSVKTNVGHLEPASGMAGLLKSVLALEHSVVPPTLNCERPNPNIAFDELNLRLIRSPEAIARKGARYAGVNSFGFGGTNGHVVLGPSPRLTGAAPAGEIGLPPLAISARSEVALRAVVQNWRETLARTSPARAPALFRAAARSRDHHQHRLVLLGDDLPETAALLDGFLDDEVHSGIIAGTAVREGRVAFAFSGNGAQWPGMGQRAFRANAAFRDAIIEADTLLESPLGWSVAEAIESGVAPEPLMRADVAQPLLFAIQFATVRVLRQLGATPSGYVGHSVGEIAAAWAAGALSLADAVRVVVARSRNQERTRGTGRMAALGLGATEAETLIAEIGCPLEVGAINSRQSVTVSGSGEAIEKLATEARRRGIVCRKLDLDFAFHSAFMEPIRDTLLADLAGLKSQAPDAGMVSTVTGNLVEAGQLDASYWWRNIRKPVRFTEALTTLIADSYRILVEIGPHPVLQSYLHDSLRAAQTDGRVLSTLNRKQPDGDPFAFVAAQCHVAGGDFTSAKWFEGAIDPRGLPLYQWQRERCWVPVTVEDAELIKPQFDHPLLGFRQHSAVPCWVSHLDQNVLPWIADHAVEGVPVFPAAGVVEMALAAARCRRPDAALLEIADLELRRPLPFDEGRGRELRSTMSSAEGDWELSSRTRLSDEPLTVHAVGRIVTTGDIQTTMHAEPILSPARIVDSVTLYALAARVGLDYGTRFRTVSRILVYGTDAAVVELDATAIDGPLEPYLIHPALLDGALQGLLALLAERESTLQAGISFLPWRFGRVRVAAALGRVPKRAQIRLTRVGSRSASADIVLCDERGAVIAELSECWFRRVALARRSSIDDRALRVELVPAPLAESNRPAVFERIGGILPRLAAAAEVDLEQGAEQALLLEALVAAVALRSILPANEPGADGLGVVDAEGSFTIDDLIESGRIAPAAGPLFGYLLHLLERFGAASSDGREWRLAEDHELPDIAEVWRLLLAEAPGLVGELALVPVVSEDLPRLFVDGTGAGRVGAAPMIENLLQSSTASAAGIDVVSRTLGEIASEWPAGRKLRVLELGADPGSTRRFLNGLAARGVAFSYVVTNPEPEQAGRLEFVADEFVEATARCWSPSDTDDPADGRFDVVLSVNASAWLQFDEAALLRLRELLAPGGLLLAVEPEPNPLWNVVFGRNPDWWQGAGEDGSPLRSAEAWRRELGLVGFEAPGTAPVSTGPWPNVAVWGIAPAVVPAVVASVARLGTIHLVGVDTAATRDLADALVAAGQVADVLDADAFLRASDFPEVESGNANAFVVFVVDASGPMEQAGSADAGAQAVGLLAKLAPKMAEWRSPFAIVTTGAQNSAIGAAVYGFGRVLLNEMPHLSLRLIDLPAGSDFSTRARLLASELANESEETEVIWTADGRHVPRLRRGLPPRWATAEDAVTLGAERPGGLDSLGWHLSKPRPPGPGEVEIDVRAAGLNFRDMMWAMGLLPEEALIDGFAGATFGLECSGVVRKVGAGVDGLAVGDRVAGFAPAALSSRVTTAAHAVMPVSAETSFAEAATIPVAFVTAIYALGTLGRLAEGEHVLIHAAAGGVGLAAIQYAKYRGAVVIATAGSPVKRSFLRLAGADHVLDSRDLGFAGAVRSLTGGAGVDVVLNSLSGEAMEQSLAVLKPFGRFLELGKRDYYLNSRIHLRPFRQNISYFGIDVDQLPIQRPELARSLLAEVSTALAEGAIRPLAHRQFAFAEIDDAFRLMQASGHIGKLVLAPSDNAGVRLHGLPEFAAHVDGTYLVTGGLSGFGFEAALWLVQRGARSIALVGRRGIQTPGAVERVNELRNAGAEVSVYAVDVANRNALSAVLGRIRAEQPPLRGIIHAASAIGDALVVEIDPATILPILQPKLGGALALDELTRKDPIDLFLLFSSATTLLGAPGQGVYVAANAALEGLARNRHAAGRPALAIAWGPIEDAGYLAERPDARDALARRLGAKPMPAVQALSCLSAVIASGLPVVAIAETSWHEARRFLPILATPFFADARGDAEAAPGDDSLIERLASLSGDEALALLKTVVAEEAAGILRLPAGSFDPLRPLSEVGMDSLMAVELRLALETRLRIDLPLVSLAEGTSVTSIAGRLAGAVSGRQQKSELIGLVERYEAADDGRVAAAVNEAEDVFDPDDVKPEAAE